MLKYNIEQLIQTLQEEEGFSATPYTDTEGKLTIGYGLNLDVGITEEEAAMLLGMRLDYLVKTMETRLAMYDALPPVAVQVLVMMAYQIGVSGVFKFKKTLKYMLEGEWKEAADEMLDSKWARQTPARAQRMSDLVREIGL